MSKNSNLRKAKTTKNDEFYTNLNDIIMEIVQHQDYVRQFYGKTVLCNCDDPESSAFAEFFCKFFPKLKLKKIITTHYNSDGSPSYKLEWDGERIGRDSINMVSTPLKGNGDFRSEECIELLKEADIVVTNPPFSLFREYVGILEKYHKDFVIIGSLNAISYKEFFPLLKSGRVSIGYRSPKEFKQPDGTIKKFGNIYWYTTLDIAKRHEPMPLVRNYYGNEERYPHYDNYDAIECGKVDFIPKDYLPCWYECPHAGECEYAKMEARGQALCEQGKYDDIPLHGKCSGVVGVPITYMARHCTEQLEIMGITDRQNSSGLRTKKYVASDSPKYNDLNARSVLKLKDGTYKQVYARILVRRKPNSPTI